MWKKPEVTPEVKGRLRELYLIEDKLDMRIKAAREHGDKTIRWNWLFTLPIEQAERKLVDIRKEIIETQARYADLKMGMRPEFAR